MISTNFKVSVALVLFGGFILTIGCKNDNACISGSGSLVTQELDLADFHSFEASGVFVITVEQSDTQRVEVTSHQNIINEISTTVQNGVWDLSLPDKCYQNLNITVRMYIPEIRYVGMNGSEDVVLNSFDSLSNLEVDITGSGVYFQSGILYIENGFSVQSSGSSNITANLHAQTVDLNFSGSGMANLTGSCDQQTIKISGAGNISGFNMVSDTSTVDISGSGDLELTVNEYLNVKISGSGDVSYMGNPVIDQDISGSGRLIDAN